MLYLKVFGFLLAIAVILTSVAMIIMGGRWQKIEAAAYSGEKRPWWFVMLFVVLIVLYAIALINFINGDKNWASWTLAVVIPVGWTLKGTLVIFNKEARKKVSSIAGDENWTKIALARLPVAIVLIVISIFI